MSAEFAFGFAWCSETCARRGGCDRCEGGGRVFTVNGGKLGCDWTEEMPDYVGTMTVYCEHQAEVHVIVHDEGEIVLDVDVCRAHVAKVFDHDGPIGNVEITLSGHAPLDPPDGWEDITADVRADMAEAKLRECE